MCMYGIHPAEQTVTVNKFTEDSAMLQWIASPHVAAIGMPGMSEIHLYFIKHMHLMHGT